MVPLATRDSCVGVVVSAWSSLTEVDVDRYLRMLAIIDLPYQLAAALAISYAGNDL